ncbi:lipocalin family protein [Xanthomonas translucens]|uniref:lipocalin family protein n=1 Tax=Xanthomonas campestris pv. translucens TaxID=343 RepID=UPI0019D5D270|nr:lipocalin family protein [Xanthomonas translucens]QSQ38159.1 lipocalin family protein [Xanthomonas translucens pv. translucens]
MRLLSLFASVLLLGMAAPLPTARAKSPEQEPSQQPPIDLQRFMGRWYVIAHVPYFAERGHVASSDEYTLKEDGKIGVRYQYREGFDEPLKEVTSRATAKDGTGNRRWTTWFFAVVPTKYRILEVAPDYSWALIDYPGRDLAWVFARTPDMDHKQYRELVDKLDRDYGINVDKLKRVAQHRAQVGKLGFEVPSKP